MHEVFVTGNLDEAKIREDAFKRSVGDKFSEPGETLIHFHPYGWACYVWVHQNKNCELIEAVTE